MLFQPHVLWTCVCFMFFKGSSAQFGRFSSARFPWRRNFPAQAVGPAFQPRSPRIQGGPTGTPPLTMREVALRQQMEVLRRQLDQVQSREIGVTRGAGSVIDNPRGLRNRFNRGFQPEQLIPPSPDIQPFPFNNVDESNVVVLEPPPGAIPVNRPSISEISPNGRTRPNDRTRPLPDFNLPGNTFPGTPVDPRDVTVVTDTGILPGSVDTVGVVDPRIGVVDPSIGVVDPTIGVVDPSVVIKDRSDPTLIVPGGSGYEGAGVVPVDPVIPVLPVQDKLPGDPLIVPVDPFIPGQDQSPVDPMVVPVDPSLIGTGPVPVDPSLIGTGPLPVGPDELIPGGRGLEWEKERMARRKNRMLRRQLRKQRRKMMRKALRNKEKVDKQFVKVIVPTTPKPAPPPPPPKKKKPNNLLANIGLGLALFGLFG